MDPVRLYISYAPRDELLCRQLEGHLHGAVHQGLVSVWHRGKLLGGSFKREECDEQRNSAEILLLLVSSDLISQAFDEVQAALARHQEGARVIPVLIRPTALAGSALTQLAMLPADGKAVTSRDNRDQAWSEVVSRILEAAEAQRRQPSRSPGPTTCVPEPTRPSKKNLILVLIAEPHTAPRTANGPEVNAIRTCLERSEHRERFSEVVELAVTPGSLVHLLIKYRPHILHFSGHGARGGQLVFENEKGENASVDPLLLGRLFRAHNEAQDEAHRLRCVVLNSCFSAEQATAIAPHVDCVLGTRGTVHNHTALAFAEGFYTALTAGHSVATATELARVQANLKGLPSPDDLQLLTRPTLDAGSLRFV